MTIRAAAQNASHRGPGRPRKDESSPTSENDPGPGHDAPPRESDSHASSGAGHPKAHDESERRGSAGTREGRARGGHAAQEALHEGVYSGGIDISQSVLDDIQFGLDSDDPHERRVAAGLKGGKITQAEYHGQWEDVERLRSIKSRHGHVEPESHGTTGTGQEAAEHKRGPSDSGSERERDTRRSGGESEAQ